MTPESKQALCTGIQEIFEIDIRGDILGIGGRGHLQTIGLARARIMGLLFEKEITVTADQRARLSKVLDEIFKIQP